MSEWRPSASLERLRQRAQLLAQLRAFFAERQVLEVETPLLASATVTDPYLEAFACDARGVGAERLYLQTSPEYAMKRLLAAGCGPIYQICKAFRADESGARHNPEFTLLEWYRPGWDLWQLMDEVDLLLQQLLSWPAAQRCSYQGLLIQHLQLDPLSCSVAELQACAQRHGLQWLDLPDRDAWLDYVFSHCVEPQLGHECAQIVYDYPASQAALACLNPNDPRTALRFEVFCRGMELANAYDELTDAQEQQKRFVADNAKRAALGYSVREPDRRLLAALDAGLPQASGIALGVDRLLMLQCGVSELQEVVAFPFARC